MALVQLSNSSLFTLVRYRQLLARLVQRDITVRYKRSALGIAWAFAEPLATMILFTVVFSYFLRIATPNYPVFVLSGILIWAFFQTGTTHALGAVTGNRHLIKKVYFPREILPLATVLGRFVHFLLSLVLLVPFLLYFRIPWSANLLLLPFIITILLLLVIGLALLFSALSTLYEDVAFLVTFLFSGLFYVSPVFYPVEMVPAAWQSIYLVNPVAALITAFRAVVLAGTAPAWGTLGLAALVSIAVFTLGFLVFKRLEWSFAEVL